MYLLALFLIGMIYIMVIYPKSYPLTRAISSNAAIMSAEGNYNQDMLVNFIESVKKETSSELRIVTYSKEGYPTIYQLEYSKIYGITCIIDDTRNVYGRDFFKEKVIYDSIVINANQDVLLRAKGKEDMWIFQFGKEATLN